MTIKIGLVGVQGGGKTTTLYGLAHELKARTKSVNIVPEMAREAYSRGFPIGQGGNFNSQMWMVTRQMVKELEAERDNTDYILTDRTVLDPIIYTRVLLGKRATIPIQKLAITYLQTKPYDLILLFSSLANGPEEDGIRDTDSEFIDAILKSTKDVVENTPILRGLTRFYWMTSTTKRDRLNEALTEVLKIK